MRVHHLNCATMCPFGGSLLGGDGGMLSTATLVAHCLLIESGNSLILVDTGFGTADVADPKRLGRPFRAFIRPKLDPDLPAITQVQKLGLDPSEVHDIVVTHLDVDHAGGLSDFPLADVHLFAPERAAAEHPTLRERERYRRAQLAHHPHYVEHTVEGDTWFGFESVKVLPGSDDEIALIPLPGHSRGHSAVAVSTSEGWLLHCGDGYFHHTDLVDPSSSPAGLRAFERLIAFDNKARINNIHRLGELARSHGDEVKLFCSHDPSELESFQAAG